MHVHSVHVYINIYVKGEAIGKSPWVEVEIFAVRASSETRVSLRGDRSRLHPQPVSVSFKDYAATPGGVEASGYWC